MLTPAAATLIAGVVAIPVAAAQVTNTFPASGNAGAGTLSPQISLHVGSFSDGYAEANNKGLLQIDGDADLETGANGIDFKVSTWGSGFGWKILPPDRGDGNTPLVFANRADSARWTELLMMRTDNGGTWGSAIRTRVLPWR